MGLSEHQCSKCGETMPYFDNCITCGNSDNVHPVRSKANQDE